MRVGIDVHTLGRQQTGNETYVRELLGALSAIPDADLELLYYVTRRHAALPAWRGEIRTIWPHNRFVRIPISFPLALRRDRIDVAHFQYVVPPVCPCPVVVAVHDISYEFHPRFFPVLQRARLKALVPRAVRKAAHVLTISDFSKRQIVERYGVDPGRVTVTHLAASPDFRVIADRDEARRDVSGLSVPDRFLLAVGNVQPRKNLSRLLGAYADLRRRGRIELPLVLVGRRAYQGSRILDQVGALGIERNVSFTGYVTDRQLVALYNLAEVFVYPSLYEGFGLPILEAMACGAPVIASNVASMPEVAGDAAVLIDPLREEEIGGAIERLAEAPELRGRLRALGLEHAARFSWGRMAEQTLAVYKRCA